MQKDASQVSSGNIAPAIVGPGKDKDVFVVAGLVVALASIIGAFWYYSSGGQKPVIGQDRLSGTEVSEALKNSQPLAMPVSLPATKVQEPIGSTKPNVTHADLYFEVGRKGLTDEAKKVLAEQAATLKNDANLGVLVQGYTDAQGSSSYNMKLGMKRAETVKAELIAAGVAEHQIKTMSLGKEGVICVDSSDVCGQMNRRVHLEIRSIGQEHMVLPTVATTPSLEPTRASIDPSQQSTDSGSLMDSLIPPADATEPGDPSLTTFDPASGS